MSRSKHKQYLSCLLNGQIAPAHQNRDMRATSTVLISSSSSSIIIRDRKQLNVFERKVYSRILGPVYDNEKRKLEDIN